MGTRRTLLKGGASLWAMFIEPAAAIETWDGVLSARKGKAISACAVEEPSAQESSVQTIEKLRQLPPPGRGNAAVVNLQGYHAVGDHGWGQFAWREESTVADDAGTTIKPVAVDGPGRWIRLWDGVNVHAGWWGVVADGDGAGGGTDNSACLYLLNAFISRNDGCRVAFPKGIMCTTRANWMLNVRSVELDFTGTILQNIRKNTSKFENYPLQVGGSIWIDRAVGEDETDRPVPYYIKTTVVRDAQVVTKHPSDAANFVIGSWALVCGYDQQGYGFPPNLRYKDYVKVVDVDASTGVVKLDRPLQSSYNERWPRGDFYVEGKTRREFGPAAIMPLLRSELYRYADNISVKNIEILRNPYDISPHSISDNQEVYASCRFFAYGAHSLRIENIVCDELTVGDCEYIECKNIRVINFQPDKCSRSLKVDRGQIANISAGTGFDQIELKSLDITHDIAVQPKRLFVDSCIFSHADATPIGFSSSQRWCETIDVVGTSFHSKKFASLFSGGRMTALPLTAGRPDWPAPNICRVSEIPATNQFAIDPGDRLFLIKAGIGTVLRRPSDQARFNIVDIWENAETGRLVVDYESNDTVLEGDELFFNSVQYMSIVGSNRVYNNRLPWSSGTFPAEQYECPSDGISSRRIDLTVDCLSDVAEFNLIQVIDGVIENVEISVTKSVNGSDDSGIGMRVIAPYGTALTPKGNIFVRTDKIGSRSLSLRASAGAQPGDQNIEPLAGGVIHAIQIYTVGNQNYGNHGFRGAVRILATRRH